MKKLLLKTALITLGICLGAIALLLGILSLVAPAVMMDFTASLGLESVSGDFAWEEFERSGDIDCLARSFLIAAEHKNDGTALGRFEALYAHGDFEEYCSAQTVSEGMPAYAFRDYVIGSAAKVKYRLAQTDEERLQAARFAFSETDKSFPAGNPVISLSLEAVQGGDRATCGAILDLLGGADFTRNADYINLVKILEEATHG